MRTTSTGRVAGDGDGDARSELTYLTGRSAETSHPTPSWWRRVFGGAAYFDSCRPILGWIGSGDMLAINARNGTRSNGLWMKASTSGSSRSGSTAAISHDEGHANLVVQMSLRSVV